MACICILFVGTDDILYPVTSIASAYDLFATAGASHGSWCSWYVLANKKGHRVRRLKKSPSNGSFSGFVEV
jgi:hypothetical protein